MASCAHPVSVDCGIAAHAYCVEGLGDRPEDLFDAPERRAVVEAQETLLVKRLDALDGLYDDQIVCDVVHFPDLAHRVLVPNPLGKGVWVWELCDEDFVLGPRNPSVRVRLPIASFIIVVIFIIFIIILFLFFLLFFFFILFVHGG